VRGEPRKDRGLLLEGQVVVDRHRRCPRRPAFLFDRVAEPHQLAVVLDRQRAEHQRVDDAENRGVGTDPQSQRKDRHHGKAGAAAHRSEGESQVFSELIHFEVSLQIRL
jgi:hypothetical protein